MAINERMVVAFTDACIAELPDEDLLALWRELILSQLKPSRVIQKANYSYKINSLLHVWSGFPLWDRAHVLDTLNVVIKNLALSAYDALKATAKERNILECPAKDQSKKQLKSK